MSQGKYLTSLQRDEIRVLIQEALDAYHVRESADICARQKHGKPQGDWEAGYNAGCDACARAIHRALIAYCGDSMGSAPAVSEVPHDAK